MSLKCAVELGIPGAVHSNGGNPVSLRELANKLSIPSTRIDDLRRLMRLLVHSGFFTCQKIEKSDGDGERDVELFLPTINSSLLLKESDISVSPFVLVMLDRILTLPWHSLGEWFRQSKVPTAFEIAHRDHFWGVTNKNASFNDSFNEGMASDASLVGKLVARVCADKNCIMFRIIHLRRIHLENKCLLNCCYSATKISYVCCVINALRHYHGFIFLQHIFLMVLFF